ncbi:hypothetical protein PoB_006447700 [Plakobranchus ocellatus]|uniref:Uncharacterized protein n=1 Tax=Plakobranchus ocellatus TaxID=259542 RepID=A0AAV4D196_9GAST|nr:hypothetical protein PoB_006447700 [Plakobranchus ocellatus]
MPRNRVLNQWKRCTATMQMERRGETMMIADIQATTWPSTANSLKLQHKRPPDVRASSGSKLDLNDDTYLSHASTPFRPVSPWLVLYHPVLYILQL